MSEAVVPHSFGEVAAVLAGAAAQERPVRVVGGGTKLGWGGTPPARVLRLHTSHLSRVLIREDGLSATVDAGTPLARAQAIFARSGRMLAADPQLGLSGRPAATIGGVVATGDCGPLSHRHGPLRDQILGIIAACPDGRLVHTGPRGEHAQDGLDLTRLFVGSYGTLGVILSVDVRLQPLPAQTATALSATADPELLHDAAAAVHTTHRELSACDVAWHAGRGGLLAQCTGGRATDAAEHVAATMRHHGMESASARGDDAGLWARQRAGQRSAQRAVLRLQHRPERLATVLRLADEAQATLVGRAALGVSYLTLDADRIATVRSGLPAEAGAVALDLPVAAGGSVDPWNAAAGPELELMREIRDRFDPGRICNPRVFVV